ncbi:hypothetical protein GCM10023187_03150 [Nibrella viscosa]|uniref:CAAX prenyl protease 2/Lysostaphin resistance protein A-like domain-containing protein n=1 Tax=Nibrella viscosa TaxID=1084524 RepID=A0ABP8JU26_9BACT
MIWGALFSIIVFPVVWGFTEEITYAGYAFPQLQIITKNTWIAYAPVAFFWAFQHVVLPLRFNPNFILYRFFSSLPIALVVLPIYMKKRRLFLFIVAHWAADCLSAVLETM